jgi:drug/metabolite transporter (DMT)-like permease
LYRGEPVRTRRLPLHLARNLIHYVGQYCWFLSLAMIPIAQVIAIEFTMPLWTALLAAGFLGEKLTAARIAAVALGLFGILLIMGPGVTSFMPARRWRSPLPCCSAAPSSSLSALTRTDLALTIIFYMFFIQTVIDCPPPHRADGRHRRWPWWRWSAWPAPSHFALPRRSPRRRHGGGADGLLRVPLSALAGCCSTRRV